MGIVLTGASPSGGLGSEPRRGPQKAAGEASDLYGVKAEGVGSEGADSPPVATAPPAAEPEAAPDSAEFIEVQEHPEFTGEVRFEGAPPVADAPDVEDTPEPEAPPEDSPATEPSPGFDEAVSPLINFGDAPTPETPDDLLESAKANSSPEEVAAYEAAFASLSPEEQAATQEIAQLLGQNPPPADLRAQLRDQIAALPPDASGRRGMDVGRTLNELGIFIPSTADEAPGSEDATARLTNVHMGDYSSSSRSIQGAYIRDMIRVADQEGFQVTAQVRSGRDIAALEEQLVNDLPEIESVEELRQRVNFVETASGGYEWGEDNKWVQQDGTVVTISDADAAIRPATTFAGVNTGIAADDIGAQGYHTAALPENNTEGTVHPIYQGAIAQRDNQEQAEALAAATGLPLERTRSYLEGGNMLSGTLPNGDPYALIGNDSILISTFDHEQNNIPEFSDENVAERRAAMGLDAPYDQLDAETQALVSDTAARLREMGRAPADDEGAAQQAAMDFIAKQDISTDILAQDIGVPRSDVTVIDQPEFHIDMYMRPLGPGQVMLNDFDANERLLNDALSRVEADSEEATQLRNMLDYNSRMREDMSPINRRIQAQLEEAGIEVVAAPGVFNSSPSPDAPLDLGAPQPRERLANFMNAVPATRPGTNERIFLTNHTSIDALREAYVDYMVENHDISQVYFLGVETSGEMSMAELSLRNQGGLDCRENH